MSRTIGPSPLHCSAGLTAAAAGARAQAGLDARACATQRGTDPWVQTPEIIEAMRVAGRLAAQALQEAGKVPGDLQQMTRTAIYKACMSKAGYKP